MTESRHGHDHKRDHDQNHKNNEQPRDKPTDDALFPGDEPSFAEDRTGDKTVETLEIELQQANDRALRAFAELDNYRKRVNREMEDTRKYAAIGLMRDMLGVWDDMNRALETVEANHNPEAFIEGVRMVHERLTQILARHHCTRIEAVGQAFDPNVHESIAQMPSDDVPANSVMYESQIGFKLYDRVVRPTQVVISTGKPAADRKAAETKDEAIHDE